MSEGGIRGPLELPDLDSLPSVLENAEVDRVLTQIMDVVEADPKVGRQDAVERMVDAIFAQGHRPGVQHDVSLSNRVARWIRDEWNRNSSDFAMYATTVIANLHCGRVELLLELLESETREAVRDEIRDCLREIEDLESAAGSSP